MRRGAARAEGGLVSGAGFTAAEDAPWGSVPSLKQALWDIYAALGFDTEGDPTPAALVHPPLEVLVLEAAQDYRHEMQTEVDQVEAEVEILRGVLRDVVGRFTMKGHPGQPCLRPDWTPIQTVEKWREIAWPKA